MRCFTVLSEKNLLTMPNARCTVGALMLTAPDLLVPLFTCNRMSNDCRVGVTAFERVNLSRHYGLYTTDRHFSLPLPVLWSTDSLDSPQRCVSLNVGTGRDLQARIWKWATRT